MSAATTFAVTVWDDGEDCHVEVKLITGGEMGLEEAIGVFAAAVAAPDELEITLENGLKVKSVDRDLESGDSGGGA